MNWRGNLSALGFVFLVWAVFGWTDETILRIHGTVPHPTILLLQGTDIDCQTEAGLSTIRARDREKLLAILLQSLTAVNLQTDLAYNNLANKETTKTADGTPFRRQFLELGSNGELRIVEDQSDFNWVYDPDHPDAMVDGAKKGYRAKPNVNAIKEQTDIMIAAQDREILQAAIRQIDPHIILGNTGQNWAEQTDTKSVTACYHAAQDRSPPLAFAKLDDPSHFNLKNLRTQTDEDPIVGCWIAKQQSSIDSGQASVATCLNWIAGVRLESDDIDGAYGFQLLKALKTESRACGVDWRDAGNLTSGSWPLIETTVNDHRLPVILAFDGQALGHHAGRDLIVVLTSVDGEAVSYVDPLDGIIKKTTKQVLEQAPSHPDGKFLFVPALFEDRRSLHLFYEL